ncbi:MULTISPECIES: DNA polymerase III subunit alpha [Bifidobacterium]|jgi:DNA polymerase-3 subunit alpha|uniref:DNA polymerase III subunit alpha n=1 Tax=Bifidobacterium tibiigranuli TaxID=2172043 RepID=A0A5N6S1N4_9BIFI|nr:DNA polymerase III subunit alpha [Bifidobacterium tibiigranuli]KAE8128349.1 DNA polymerase III subunit alpha [Bifidobacterium tibiigranuli]KAE8128636.1 DNA polymerase III subunit alpha [Bifidobacterium tibiigranuli]MCH3974866.1 DNA polymerase III subunit alpha [Bifidobacterium tibiigranuli]MCH4190515.1 DNA polymerase III subunit alpha [Bifidobacterium tibiigranuli]MCH4202626.1 DNA polymerase III subunit alpha [Bifidobacterium tibiigranuli]
MANSGNFVQLHNHTHYSLLDGASKIPDLVARAKELDMPAVAITDHGNMHGAYEMWSTCVKAGIKPIIGIEAYVTPETARQDKTRVHWGNESQRSDDVSGGGLITHMTMWAQDDEGLVNLLRASSVANLEGRVARYPRMDYEVLAQYSKGVIASSGCPSGIIQTRLRLGQFDEALRAAGQLQDIYGRENFYIELMDHGLGIEKRVTNDLLKIAKLINAPLLATNDSHYVHEEDRSSQDAMLCINSGSRLDDPNRFKFDGSGYYLKSAEEMRELFKDHPEACDNTLEIAERCNVMFDDSEDGAFMPEFDCPDGWDETSLFLKDVQEGLERRYEGNVPEHVLKQADYECGVICQMQFCGYFLVVADYINWAKTHGVMVGPGRGSAAGSMVSYAMGITELDPLKHGLIFERFLNPERVSLPDIDVDFDPDGRAKVLDYVGEKYGRDKVAQCVIYGTIKTKQALKDSARIMGYEFSVGEHITKALPPSKNGKDASLKDIFDPTSKRFAEAREFRELYESDPDTKRITEQAKGIEGLIRQTGVHACATIMGSEPITDTSPLLERTDGTVTTTFEYHTCETLGLVKMDFLGLSNLTVIRDTLLNIERNGKDKIDYTKIPLDDKETYQLLSRGDTLGVFQLDSDGMRSLLRQLKPDNFNDISALIALYRPGPMDMDSHTNYAKRKNGLQRITPIHPEVAEPLAAVLDETYGLIVYQEQVQSAARILAGYSLGRADVLRRAMGKKKPEVLAKEQVPFFEGMKEHGYSEEAAQAVWDILVPFSGYAFNKAHSAAYGLISYWTAYLKTHYPVEFMAALLQNERTNKDKTALYLGEARRMGIQVLPPDVNESILEYSAVGDVVRFGLGAIRNVGDKAVADIIAERETGRGRYVNFMDFVRRVSLTALNRRLVESLIKAGAFDSIDPNRRALFQIHEAALDSVISLKRKQAEGQFDLFADMDGDGDAEAMGDASVIVPDIEEWDKKTKLNFEREMLGLYVSDHPLSGMTAVLGGLREMSIAHLIDRAKTMDDRQQVTLAGLITSVDRRVSRKGNPWAIVTIEDMESSIQCMFFGKVYEAASQDLAVDEIVQIRGQVEVRDESTPSLRATELQVPTLEAADERPVMITLPTVALDRSRIGQLGQVLHEHPGYCEVKLAVLDERGNARVLTFGDRFRVKRDTSLFAEIKILFGPSCLPAA